MFTPIPLCADFAATEPFLSPRFEGRAGGVMKSRSWTSSGFLPVSLRVSHPCETLLPYRRGGREG